MYYICAVYTWHVAIVTYFCVTVLIIVNLVNLLFLFSNYYAAGCILSGEW